ncbi:Ku protein [Roseivirga sp. BDSF3-8]|uniref:non-homologous end joining protein Ku n=1 Tax=Roseivirga sp. BDSF3-8 TaxID=3241598 RepID=UPI0035320BF6
MRAIWKGAIGFGLVNIPIKLYSATESRRLDLDMLDKSDHERIRYKRVNQKTGKEVDWDDIVKGYLMEDDYIILEDEDFDKAAAKKSKIIEINEFVEEGNIDGILYKNPYFIEPEKSGQKAYALLREALTKTEKVGIATFVLRSREDLAVIRPAGNVLYLQKIRFAEEVRSPDELNVSDDTELKKKELDMAVQLIENYSTDFDLGQYKDTYTDALMQVIEAKAKGKKPKVKKMEVAPTEAKDLMAQLKASLQQKKAS